MIIMKTQRSAVCQNSPKNAQILMLKYYDGSRAPSPRERERHRRVPAAATTTAAVVTPNDSDHTTAVVEPGPMSPTDIAPENQERGVGATQRSGQGRVKPGQRYE